MLFVGKKRFPLFLLQYAKIQTTKIQDSLYIFKYTWKNFPLVKAIVCDVNLYLGILQNSHCEENSAHIQPWVSVEDIVSVNVGMRWWWPLKVWWLLRRRTLLHDYHCYKITIFLWQTIQNIHFSIQTR